MSTNNSFSGHPDAARPGTTPEPRERVEACLAPIASISAVLAVFLLVIRAHSLYGWKDLHHPLQLVRNLGAVAYYDWAYVAALAIVLGLAALQLRGRARGVRLLAYAYSGLAVVSVVLALVNVTALKILGRPINYQWLYYSHFLRSFDSHNAIRALASPRYVAVAAALSLLLLACARFARPVIALAAIRLGSSRLTALTAVAVLAYFVIASPRARLAIPSARLENPIVSFLVSVVTADRNPTLMRRATAIGPDDFLPAGQRSPRAAGDPASPTPALAQHWGVRNVVMIVLESLPAEYVGAFGSRYGATPTLDSLRPHARLFSGFYAHVPSTDHSLVSLLLSVYPPLSYRTLTLEYPRVRLPSLSGELKRRGYRTAFFSTSDNRFQNMDRFLATRGFDIIADHRTIRCGQPVFPASTKEWQYLDATTDGCGAAALRDWVIGSPERPFFAVLWTAQTHFPYFAIAGKQQEEVSNPRLRRFLAALYEGDRAIGAILHGLSQRGLLDSTLIVVLGDHGEAFGRHGTLGHGNSVYEEEVHIPLMLVNPRLFHGEVDSALGAIIDLAPTVADMLGLPDAATWQGRSLLARDRTNRVYFFEPFSTFAFGLREGSRKILFDGTTGRVEVYDLATDPQERHSLAQEMPAVVNLGLDRLAAWVQYQEGFFQGLLGDDAR
jgi:arylsulfatase A-like enzyme